MRVVGIKAFGGPEALEMMDIPIPEPGPGQALVKLAFAGVNYIDVYMRKGVYARAPGSSAPTSVIGMEGAGEVVKVGSDTGAIKVGDRVAWCMVPGGYAEYAVVPAWRLAPVPSDVPLDIACALQLQGSTAHYLAHTAFPLRQGDVALVHAGAGGVGQLLVQIAKARGAAVIATVGTDAKAAIAKSRGADATIVYTREDFLALVKEMTGGEGVSVAYDAVGKDTLIKSMQACRRRGVVVSYGAASGAVEAIPMAEFARSIFVTRAGLADYTQDAAEVRMRVDDLVAAWRAGKLVVPIDRVWPLEGAREAHKVIEGRGTLGKLLLKVVM